MAEMFNPDAFQQKLNTSSFGKRIVYMDVTGSTMDDARKLGVSDPQLYPHGTIVMAERQTKARGARDHKWDATNTGNIYLSIILHMPQIFKSFEGKFDIEVAACMAVWRVVQRLGVKVVPKWPNDLWVKGHKLAGFLAEDGKYEFPDSNLCLLIIGMGINVNADVRRSPELNSIAASLLCERNGEPVCREDFLSDICSAFEESLMLKFDNLNQFRTHNLFQKGCSISVTCPSENQVMDGQFEEVCDNWDVKFMDRRTSKMLQGRSDYYTIRPKVQRKILVVFSGIGASRSAAAIASQLTSIVDTSKYVICSVPESAITQSEDWMKTCHLVVVTEDVCDPVRLTSKLKIYLKQGGNFLALGMASSFAAKTFDISYKEGVLESLADNTDFSVVSLEYEHESEKDKEGNALTCSHVIFPSSVIYLKFSKGSISQTLTSKMKNVRKETESGDSSEKDSSSCAVISHPYVRYFQGEAEDENCIAILTCPTNSGGSIALFGFDLGVSAPSYFLSVDEVVEKNCEELTEVEKIVKELHGDRFKRDKLFSQILTVLHVV